jgi:hypothetical protein
MDVVANGIYIEIRWRFSARPVIMDRRPGGV